MDAFDTCLAIVLAQEGGFVNNPHDPGGMTNLGVTADAWAQWTHKPATADVMHALNPDLVAPFYEHNYWHPIQCDGLPVALALCVFDFAVNAGITRAATFLQKVVTAPQDGVVGQATLARVETFIANVGLATAIRDYQQYRRIYYRALNGFSLFGRGWLRRVDKIETEALKLI